jgi:hypothetical protein
MVRKACRSGNETRRLYQCWYQDYISRLAFVLRTGLVSLLPCEAPPAAHAHANGARDAAGNTLTSLVMLFQACCDALFFRSLPGPSRTAVVTDRAWVEELEHLCVVADVYRTLANEPEVWQQMAILHFHAPRKPISSCPDWKALFRHGSPHFLTCMPPAPWHPS